MSNLKKIEEQLQEAPNIKSMLQLEVVQKRFIANYESNTGKKDGKARFENEVFAYMEIIADKPALANADRFSHFAAIVKAGRTGLSFRDNKLYVMPGPNNTVKVQSSPAGKREMMENMPTVKSFPEAQVVLKGDIFTEDKLNNTIIKHESTKDSAKEETLDNITHSYQKIVWKDGKVDFVVVTHKDLLKARAKSPAQSDKSFWDTFPGEAAKKVATNRAYRIHHKYTDNEIDTDEEEDEAVVETTHKEVKTEQPKQPEPEQPKAEHIEDAQVVEEPKVDKPKKKSAMNDLLNE